MQWTEDLSVGVEAIDNQRRELFIRINSLADAI
jgi:hemerythrin